MQTSLTPDTDVPGGAPVEIVVAGGYGRDFRLYATGRAVSVLGDRVAVITLVFLIIHLVGTSGPAVGLFYVCRAVPTLVGGLVTGVVADHFDRRRLLMLCDLVRGVLFVAVPTLAALGLWTIFPIVIVVYTLTMLFNTAAQAALPDVVPEMKMIGANSILSGIQNAADIGYAAGGALVFVLGYAVPFYIDAATFFFSFVMIWMSRIPSPPRGPLPDVRAVLGRIWAGITYTSGMPFLRWTTITFFVSPFAGGVAFVIGPLYAARILRHSVWLFGPLTSGAFRFSVLEVGIGVGALAGSAAVPALADRVGRGRLVGLGIAGTGLADVPLAFTNNVYLAIVMMILAGFFTSLGVIPAFTLVQKLTPTEMRGRVVAARLTVINGALAFGSAVGGAAVLAFSIPTLWALEAVLIVAGSLFAWLPATVRDQV